MEKIYGWVSLLECPVIWFSKILFWWTSALQRWAKLSPIGEKPEEESEIWWLQTSTGSVIISKSVISEGSAICPSEPPRVSPELTAGHRMWKQALQRFTFPPTLPNFYVFPFATEMIWHWLNLPYSFTVVHISCFIFWMSFPLKTFPLKCFCCVSPT